MESELVNEIFTTTRRIQDLVQTLANTIDSALSGLSFLLGWIADKVRDAWNYFMGKLSEFWSWLNHILSNMGDADAVTRAANGWSDQVAGPVTKEVGNADAGLLLVDDKWDGDAADLYKQIIPLQKTALDKIKTGFTDGISLALSQLRTAITTFKGALIVALAALAAGIIGAIFSADTIFGIPAVPFIAAGAVAICSAAIYYGVTTLQSANASANTQLRQKLNDSTGYPGGKWPTGVLH
ncbi:MAG: hypothetical protein DLM58_13455 [Pseudonocardiales bacterium]|nr:MAG: hypothetical protein DLM58_13455 [Pseudonocardiales bacterium]